MFKIVLGLHKLGLFVPTRIITCQSICQTDTLGFERNHFLSDIVKEKMESSEILPLNNFESIKFKQL